MSTVCFGNPWTWSIPAGQRTPTHDSSAPLVRSLLFHEGSPAQCLWCRCVCVCVCVCVSECVCLSCSYSCDVTGCAVHLSVLVCLNTGGYHGQMGPLYLIADALSSTDVHTLHTAGPGIARITRKNLVPLSTHPPLVVLPHLSFLFFLNVASRCRLSGYQPMYTHQFTEVPPFYQQASAPTGMSKRAHMVLTR
jgi:hypothetical protein